MCDNDITKIALAASMKNLMNQVPMKKICIRDIVDACNMNRQSFYYHFKDKYDLVNWIYHTEFISSIDCDNLDKFEFLEKVCTYFYENRVFYKNAFEVTGQNSFSEYFTETTHDIVKNKLAEVFKNRKYMDFYLSFYSDAIKASIARWLIEGASMPPDKFVGLLKNAIFKFADYIND